MVKIICRICGHQVERTSSNQKYCLDCREGNRDLIRRKKRNDLPCPICFRKLKTLFEIIHVPTISKKGKEYSKHKFKGRALYCGSCKVVYPIDLIPSDVADLKTVI